MTKTEALKNLYAALGGAAEEVEDKDTIAEVITAISEKISGGSDSPIKIVTATCNNTTITFDDETQDSIYQAVSEGAFVYVIDSEPSKTVRFICTRSDANRALFVCVRREDGYGATFFNYFWVQKGNTTASTSCEINSAVDNHEPV